MAWVATDDAESYANGNALNGLNGGSNWSGAWSKSGTGGTADIVNSPTLQGSLAFHLQGGNSGEPEALRSFSAITSGKVSFIVRADDGTQDTGLFGFQESTTRNFSFVIDGGNSFGFGTSHLVAFGSTNVDLGAYSTNTNYTIVVDFDCGTDQFRVSVDGGATFSSLVGFENNATNIDNIRWRYSRTQAGVDHNYYFDAIQPFTAGPTNVKTWDGLSLSSISKIDGLAIASIKSINGIT